MNNSLFEPIKAGDLLLKNKIVMAPLTRSRASGNDGRTPNALMAKYYAERADFGMILTEATAVDPMGVGYANTPGIWSEEHINGWKLVTDAVHEKGGLILLQLWHVGRISHPHFLNGQLPVAPSAIKPDGHVSLLRPQTEFVTPRALETHEIKGIIDAYKTGAINAKKAGFDGVEIHAANGYLIDQFLQDGTNSRTDQYGGSLENRARLLLEITDAVIEVFGSGKVGVHLAPRGDAHSMKDSNPRQTFTYVAKELSKRNIAFIFTREYVGEDSITPDLKEAFKGFVIGNEKLNLDQASSLIAANKIDAASFGVLAIANPDLVKRFKNNLKLNDPIPATFYAEGSIGYTDYPHYE